MNETILLSHGGGGEEMSSLINETIFRIFDNEILRESNDSAILDFGEIRICESADGLPAKYKPVMDKRCENAANLSLADGGRAAGEFESDKLDAKNVTVKSETANDDKGGFASKNLAESNARIGRNLNLDDERYGSVSNFKNASADIASQNGASGEDLSSKQCAAKTNCKNLSDTNPNFELNFKNRAAPNKTPNLTRKFSGRLAFSTDSFVVTPIFFNGGDIGKIAACGTINDLAMVGAEAKYLSCALIVEEGLEIAELERVLGSLAAVARENGVQVVCGDTKVVPRGKCDKIFINTSGIGEIICEGVELKSLRAGAKILLSGDVGRHGAVVLASREEFDLQSELKSDCKALVGVVKALIAGGVKPLCMRDATRGGLSAALNEWAKFSGLDILVREEDIRVSDEVTGVCELFGFEPYELANEGTFVLAVDEKDEERALEILRKFDANAALIGEILGAANGRVILQNAYGSKRFLEAPKGELLPRIC